MFIQKKKEDKFSILTQLCVWIKTQTNKYRRIFWTLFNVLEQISEVLRCQPIENDGKSPYMCQMYFNRLNKFYKTHFDLKHKIYHFENKKEQNNKFLNNLG